MSKSENSNQPEIINNKRQSNFRDIDTDITSTDDYSSISEDDTDDIIHQKQRKSKQITEESVLLVFIMGFIIKRLNVYI